MVNSFCSVIKMDCVYYVAGECCARDCAYLLDLSTASKENIERLRLKYLERIYRNLKRQKDSENQNDATPRQAVRLCAKPVVCKHECAGFCRAPADNKCDYMHVVNLTNMEYAALVAKMRNKTR